MNTSISDQAVGDQTHTRDFFLINDKSLRPAGLHQAATATLPAPLCALIEHLEPDMLREMMRHIFTDLARLLDHLSSVEGHVRQDGLLEETLSEFTRLHRGARFLLDFIDICALRAEDASENLRDALDGTSFAISYELRRIFEFELAELNDLPHAPPVRAKLERACGLLRNCFQQSTIALAQAFDPALDGASLFSDFQIRCEQSLLLYEDLCQLIEIVQHTEKECDQPHVTSLIEILKEFRDGSMRFLMYRDWETYERFVDGVMVAADNLRELRPLLHQLSCYLKILLEHVKKRLVLIPR